MASSVELYANCRCRGQQGLDVPHDKPLKALHNDGFECNGPVVIEAGHCGLLQHGDDGDGLEACWDKPAHKYSLVNHNYIMRNKVEIISHLFVFPTTLVLLYVCFCMQL